jgi:hypothetical protein
MTEKTPQASPSQALSLIAADMQGVDALIAQRLSTSVALVGDVSQYIIAAGGKRLRPQLLLLCCGALGYTADHRLTMAAVVEFIHTATLLHDDVVDDSTLRRGLPTANAARGTPSVFTILQQSRPSGACLGVVSRLDAPVSGVLVMAKTRPAARPTASRHERTAPVVGG